MSSRPDLDSAPLRRAAAAQASALMKTPADPDNPLRRKPSGAVTYVQPSGADLFPELGWVKALFNKLRHA